MPSICLHSVEFVMRLSSHDAIFDRVCRRIPDPESWTDNRGTMEPSPFGDLFGEPQDIFAVDVRI